MTFAQQLPATLRFKRFTTENGLTDNSISSITKDKSGYLWLATHGINRFDGAEFKTFLHDPGDSNSLLSNYAYCIANDSLDRKWIATFSGLSMYDPATGKFWNFVPPEKDFVQNNVIRVKTARDGSVWFSTWNKLNTIDLRSLKITSYLIDTAAPNKNNVSIGVFFEDHNGDFWFDSYKGIYIFDRRHHTVTKLPTPSGLSAFYDDGKGKVYFGGWGGGLKEYDIVTKKTTEYFFHNSKFPLPDSQRAVTWISRSDHPLLKNYLWISTPFELAVFDVEKKKFIRFYQFEPTNQNIVGAWAEQSFFDENNNFWLASTDGLYVASLDQLATTTYYLHNPKSSGGLVSRIREDIHDPSVLWAGVNGSGVFKVDSKTGEVLQNFLPEKTTAYTDSNRNFVFDFLQSKNGDLWLAGGVSMSCYNPLTGKNYFLRTPPVPGFPGYLNGTYSLLPKSDSDCWVSTDAGIGSFNFINHTFKFDPYYNLVVSQSYDEHYVKLMKKDTYGNLWFYNHNDGFFMYNPESSKFTRIIIPGVKLTNLISRGLTQSGNGTIWLSADDRLFYKKPNDSTFHNTSLPPVKGFLFDIAADKKNNLYLLTRSGIIKYENETAKLTAFTSKDGFISNSTTGLDVLDDGRIFLKGTNYFSEINTEKFRQDYVAAPLIFESVSINGKDSSVNFDEYKTRFFHLGYKQNQVTLRFRLMNFLDPGQTNYSYKLQGWDKDWVSSGTGNVATYSNLPGGDYTLVVKAMNPDGSENLQQAKMMIHIDEPFWKTWWFIALCLLVTAGVIYFIFRLVKERKIAVEKIRAKISRDLHDDVGSTLTSINIWSEVAQKQMQNTEAQSAEYLSRIKTSSQNMLDNMNDIIWAINPVNDTLEKVLIRMKLYASEMLEPKNISFLFSVDNEIKNTVIPMQYRREWYLIFKEAINNAAKYSCAKNIEVSILLQHQNLVMHIKDDGKGFLLDEKNETGNGLRNMEQRAGQMKASLRINSSPGAGTEIILEQKFT